MAMATQTALRCSAPQPALAEALATAVRFAGNSTSAGHAYGGISNRQGIMMDCPTEERVFALLGWDWIEPKERVWPPK